MKDQSIIAGEYVNNVENFYSPLCKSGYLTPLQRKKLRELRKVDLSLVRPISSDQITERIPKKAKKSLGRIKKKSSHFPKRKDSLHTKVKSVCHATKKENIPQLQCAITHLLEKKLVACKDRKFFRSRSPDHLEKTNVTIPLWKKNLRFDSGGEGKNLSSVVQMDNGKKLCCAEFNKKSEEKICENESLIPVNCKFANEKLSSEFSNDRMAPIMPLSSVENTKFPTSEHSKKVPSKENVSASSKENSNTFEFEFDWPSDEVLLERQKREREKYRRQLMQHTLNIAANDKKNKNVSENSSSAKLYPIFLHSKISDEGTETKRINLKKTANCLKGAAKASDQLIIDAGQKDFGPKICSTCGMVFSAGEENDETVHAKYHDMYLINLRFPGWKNERIVGEYTDGRVIMVTKESKNFMLKKVKEILIIANRDLGFPSDSFPIRPNATFLLFITNDKRVAGCVVGESITSGCPVILDTGENSISCENKEKEYKNIWKMGNWCCSSERVSAICGVNRIWVAKEYRRHKIASRLMDCLRCNFLYGYVVGIRELAFTDPSPDGREFAAAYTGTDNFLVYK